MDAQQRVSYRPGRLGFWLKRLALLRSEESILKSLKLPQSLVAKYPPLGDHAQGR